MVVQSRGFKQIGLTALLKRAVVFIKMEKSSKK
jgi:hypothetical protein